MPILANPLRLLLDEFKPCAGPGTNQKQAKLRQADCTVAGGRRCYAQGQLRIRVSAEEGSERRCALRCNPLPPESA